jgi:hypothetical protein
MRRTLLFREGPRVCCALCSSRRRSWRLRRELEHSADEVRDPCRLRRPPNFYPEDADSKISTVQKLRRALEIAGVQFIDVDDEGGPGVRLRADKKKR